MTQDPENDVAGRSVTAAVLIIGDEILSGQTQDLNLIAIARHLAGYGVDLKEVRVVSDDRADIVAAVDALRVRYDYLVTTGGIGPTHDDITAECVAEAFGLALHVHPEIMATMLERWGPETDGSRRRMARVPEGGTLVRNPAQGPPGFQIGNVFVLAGVPSIMRGMLEDVGPRLKGGVVVVSRTLRVDGVGEGVIAAPLERVAKAYPALSLGSYPFFGADGIGSRLVIRGRDAAQVEAAAAALTTALSAAGVDQVTVLDAA